MEVTLEFDKQTIEIDGSRHLYLFSFTLEDKPLQPMTEADIQPVDKA